MPQGYDLLSVTRINRIMQVITENLVVPEALLYLARTVVQSADEGEIMGTYEGSIVSADIIQDDAAAVVRSAGRFALSSAAIPNLKQGVQITQGMVNLLRRINRGGGIPNDQGLLSQYLRNEVAARLQAVRILMNRMIVGMHLDLFTYRKMGVIYDNVSWGMPAGLKFVPAIEWTLANKATATPIQDLLLYKRTAADTPYGESYNRLRLSTKLLNIIFQTDDFRNNAKPFTTVATDAGTFGTLVQQTNTATRLFEQITGLQIETYDATYQDEYDDGTKVTKRYQPEHLAVLGNTADDNNAETFDFANAVVNESEMGNVPGTQVIGGGFAAPVVGPVAYATIKGDLNPPQLTLWGVGRGFPRKKRATATSRITAYTP